MISALSSACSRTDFFIFDGYLPTKSNTSTKVEAPELQSLVTPELHLLIFWSALQANELSRLHHVVAALSEVVNYPEAGYHVQLRGVFRVDPGVGQKIDESWYQAFYGDTYYGLYFGTSDKVDMEYVKGGGAFHVLLVEDLCPKYAYDLKRDMILNTNMFALKNLLRKQSPQWYQVHTTQTLQESNADYKFLFGGTALEVFRSLQLDKFWLTAAYRKSQVVNSVYNLAWKRIFIPVDSMEMLGAMMQSEWYRFELDVPEIHVRAAISMSVNLRTFDEVLLFAAGRIDSGRLPLLAHLPGDSRWYKGMLELKHVKAFRVLKENGWGQQLPPCSTVEEAAAILSSKGSTMSNDSSLRDHVRQLQHRLDHFNHTMVVVGASVKGPFTIWDGNHRAIALALTQQENHLLLRGGCDSPKPEMEQRHDGAKKPSGALEGLSPRGLLKRGWNGVTSPLNAFKDSVVAAATPRSVAATPTNRMTLPSPTEYPSLFDVRGPSSTRSVDGAVVSGHKSEFEAHVPQSVHESSNARTGSWGSSGRTASSSRGWVEEGAGDVQGEEERAYLSVCHHNLHSVLTNPKATNWGGALLDVFYPTLDVDIALAPFPGLVDVSTRDFQPYLRQFGTSAATYEENHVKPVNEQLSSSNVPSISVADGKRSACNELMRV
ncbi:unnamed protein product [Phytophthora fragariaefolia]|uniref:Unnamed protein product n=1 Tax=Phytophthora fragariaefolia TaxID=1490495 RepID=A0A9W6TND3_9STRA|nr:unnamed protein product [Phytophthora fragariaefolia]